MEIEVVLARLTPDPDADRESMNFSDDERRRTFFPARGFVAAVAHEAHS